MKKKKILITAILTISLAIASSGCNQSLVSSLATESEDKTESSYTGSDNTESEADDKVSEAEKTESEESEDEAAKTDIPETNAPETEKPESKDFSVAINIECEENLAFSRYDVEVYVDGSYIGTMDHGVKKSFQVKLKKGTHEITFTKEGDTSVDGTADVTISAASQCDFLIHCRKDQVKIKEATTTIN